MTNRNFINAAAHITGGGLIENLLRSVPDDLTLNIDLSKIKILNIFKWLKSKNISDDEMIKTFNCGVGFCIIVPKKNLEQDLPGMAWDMLPSFDKYRTAGWHSWSNNTERAPFAALYTSLGCPYKCSFCMINIINRVNNEDGITSEDSNAFRWWSPDFIIKQFDYFAQRTSF